MNILKAFTGGLEEFLLEKNGRYYRFADRDARPSTLVRMIEQWPEVMKADIVQTSRPRRFSVPLQQCKIFLPAVNFRSHATETGITEPEEPYFFCKFPHSLLPHGENVVRPREVHKLAYEGEIGVVIGKRGKYIHPGDAADHIFGYTVVDDVTFRDYLMKGNGTFGRDWVLGKNADTALPIGPWITPVADFGEFPTTIETKVNGKITQSCSTDDMIFPVERLISRVSRVVTLEPGDLITTGTPAVLAEDDTSRFLQPGDAVEITVDRVGTLKHGILED